MGQGLSCGERHDCALFSAVQDGDLEMIEAMVEADPSVLEKTTRYAKSSALHVAAAYGRIEVLCFLLNRFTNPDVLNRHKQTPLMLAAMHGKTYCVKKLLQSGAFVLMFDSLNGRTCLHYAAYYGHFDCLQTLLSAAQSSSISDSWGFARFVNIRDETGATPLHLAASQGWSDCVHTLLDNGALVCASTGGNGYPGSTPLHFAARGGSIESVRELLAWGADRLQPDSYGRIPYVISLKYKHDACAALLNPASAEPLVWPLPLRFISNPNPDAKSLLETALREANKEREKALLKETIISLPSPSHSDDEADDMDSEASDVEVCCICFDRLCTIETRPCGHRMCAHCTLALCCHKKPNPLTSFPTTPVCPFCRSNIAQLVAVEINNKDTESDVSPSRPRRSSKPQTPSEASSSFKCLSPIGSLVKIGARNSGRISSECNEGNDKP